MSDIEKRLAVLDMETDPFQHGVHVKPFTANFYDGETHAVFWGNNCVEQLVIYIKSLKHQYIIYAHNGGNFDFYFMLAHLEQDCLLIKNRIGQAYIGGQELRDSYLIFPDPLSAYKKDDWVEADYIEKMHYKRRHKYKDEIIHYMKNDCVYLYEIVSKFHAEFGDHLTIGSCAMKQLKKVYKFEAARKPFHDRIQPFYFGGRNQCFEVGMINAPQGKPFKMFDINKQYASVMRNVKHPTRLAHHTGTKIGPNTYFAKIRARNYGALPHRHSKTCGCTKWENTGLDFTLEHGEFFAGIHEIEAGLETGTLQIEKVLFTYDFEHTQTFGDFVDQYTDKATAAKAAGDNLGALFYKRIVNSCYGKFSQNPDGYMDSAITHDEILPQPWTLQFETQGYMIWGKPTEHKSYYNISTGASITSAARAILLRALAGAVRPIYCDTDSIICEDLKGVDIDPLKMGAWKHEGDIDTIAIAGKKLYAAFGRFEKGKTEKKAHKGAVLTAEQIVRIAKGDAIEYASPAPKFRLSGETVFVKRVIRSTGKEKPFNPLKRVRSAGN